MAIERCFLWIFKIASISFFSMLGCTYVCVGRLTGYFVGVVLSFHHVGPSDQAQVIRLGSKQLCLLGQPSYRLCVDI